MAINHNKTKSAKFPGVFRLPDGRFMARATVRTPGGQIKVAKKLWGALCKAAGITQRVGPQVLLLEGVDRVTLRAILGHSSESMTQRYAGIGDAAKADAILKVGSATQEQPKRPKLVLLRGGSR